jgi:hypothetical protein
MNLQNRDSMTEKVNGDAKFGISAENSRLAKSSRQRGKTRVPITEKDMQSEPQTSNNDGSCQDYQAV